MYNDVKSNSLTEEQAVAMVGRDTVSAVLDLECDFSNRVIDDVYNVVEMSASIEIKEGEYAGATLVVNYLIDKDDLDDAGDDLGACDYSNYTFEII